MIYRSVTQRTEINTRLDLYLTEKTDFSRTKVRKIIDLGGVHIDNKRVRKCSFPLKKNQQITLFTDEGPLLFFRLQDKHILFQDQYLIVINKPAGVETQPTPARYKGTLYEALLFYLKNQGIHTPKIGIHQRLDRETSGLLSFSLHPAAHKNIAKQLQNRTLQKEYLALVSGKPAPSSGTIHSQLARKRGSNQMTSVDNRGKEAITHYQTLESFSHGNESCSLLSVRLETGRSHQIRVHFAEQGHPLIGDKLYGGTTLYHNKRYHRQCLHSYRLALQHPKSGEKLFFEAAPPQEVLP